MTKEQKKKAILAGLLVGESPKELGLKYEISPIVISGWAKKQRRDAENEDVMNTAKVDPVVLEAVAQEIKSKAKRNPEITTPQLNKLDVQLDLITEGVVGVQRLEDEFHRTMMNLLTWANAKITDDMKTSEWTHIVKGVSGLHDTMFGKGSNTQINLMQQNNGGGASSAKVDKFRGGFRI